jgi:NADH dehydrogenase
MAKLATIYGGAGFIGSYITCRLLDAGWRVRVASRRARPTSAAPDQIEHVACSILEDASVAKAAEGADAIVNCVGTFDAHGANNFQAIQAAGAARIAQAAAQHGIGHMVHLSAIGADPKGASTYAKTKAAGEAGVLQHMPGAMILRPSVVFGPEDEFFNRFAAMAPVVPVVGGATRFQPVYVDDVAQAAALGVTETKGGVFELGGPQVASFADLMALMLQVTQKKRLVVDIPLWAGGLIAQAAYTGHRLSGGLLPAPITPDQVLSLKTDNVVSEGAKTLADLGITATAMEDILPGYLAPR